jgi:hypothetical protein
MLKTSSAVPARVNDIIDTAKIRSGNPGAALFSETGIARY